MARTEDISRGVPDDVLLHIFGHSVQDDDRAIWTIATVNRRWRTAALPRSGLWKYLHYNGSDEKTAKLDIARMIIQLERTGSSTNLQLDMRLHSDHARSSHLLSEQRREEAAWRLLVDNAPRFRVVKLRGYLQSRDSFPSAPPDFCNLWDLSITTSNALEVDGTMMFARTPLLHTLSLAQTGMLSAPQTPWTRLSSLSFGWRIISPPLLLKILTTAPNLTHLKTYLARYPSHGITQQHPVELPNLRIADLSIDVQGEHEQLPCAWFFDHVLAPHLHSLKLESINIHDTPSICGFLRTASSSLTVLSLHPTDRNPLDSTSLLSILQTVRRLQTLETGRLQANFSVSPILRAMTSPEERLLPQLESLAFQWCRVALPDLKALVESRSFNSQVSSGALQPLYSGIKKFHFIHPWWEDRNGRIYDGYEEADQWASKVGETNGGDFELIISMV